MTIALGILTPDGVVIAADTQESWGYMGGAKIAGHKIMTRVVATDERACSATGAGSAGYIDSLNQELTDNFLLVSDRTKIERRCREKVMKFHEAHILPMHVYPPLEQPSVSVIVGMSWKGQKPLLLANDRSALRRIKHHTTAGAGQAHASNLLNRLLPDKLATTTELAAFLAAYVVFHVKGYVEGCGLGTHVTVLKDGKAKYIPERVIAALEKRFEQYDGREASIVGYISGAPAPDPHPINDLSAWLTTMRAEIQHLGINESLMEVIDEADA